MNSTFIIILAGRVLQIVLSLASVKIFTSLLSIKEVGNLYLINSLVGLIALTAVNPVGMYINRRLHKWAGDRDILNYFFVFNLYLIALSVLSMFAVFFLNRSFGFGHSIDIKMLSLFILLNVYFNTWHQTIIPSLNMLEFRRSFVAFTLSSLVLGLAFSIGMVKSGVPSAVSWLSGQLAAQGVTTIIAFVYFKKVTKTAFDFTISKKALTRKNFVFLMGFAIPLAITTFFMWMQNQSYRIIVEHYIGIEFLGMIGVGLGISGSIAAAVESLAQQIYYPVFYSEINTSDPTKRAIAWNKMAQLAIPIYLSVTLLVTCLAPHLVRILLSEKFSQAYVFVIYGSWVEMFRMTTNVLSGVAHSEMQTRSLIKAYLIGGVVVAIGVYFGTMAKDYQHVIPAILVVSGFVTMLIMFLDMKRLMVIEIPFAGIGKSLAYSSPFAIALFFNRQPVGMVDSILFVLFFGSLFTLSQYSMYKSALGQRTA